MLEKLIYFECPYCGKQHNLTRLLAAGYITKMTSIFLCYSRDVNEKDEGCDKEFILDLTLVYEIDIRAIEGERKNE